MSNFTSDSRFKNYFKFLAVTTLLFTGFVGSAHALQLDWSGQFWFEHHWINNHQLERGRPAADADMTTYDAGGPYVPGVGEKSVDWYSAFLKLKPKIIVNDSVHIKSEWHVGSPIYGFLGRNFPSSAGEQFQPLNSQRDGANITAQRFWASLITDFGTIDLGRSPQHWGLGAIWNNGDKLFNRYQSTADQVRLTSKFGNFSVSPAVSKVAMGYNAAGALDTTSISTNPNGLIAKTGNDDVTDYHVGLLYDNTEEDFSFGLQWTRRVGNADQSAISFNPNSIGSSRLNFNIIDFYIHKKLGRFTLGGEVPVITGSVGGIDGSTNSYDYRSLALIFEGNYSSDSWDVDLKAGHVPGQGDGDVSSRITGTSQAFVASNTTYSATYLHRSYNLGMIMFHYNLYGFAGNNPDLLTGNRLRSPYDNPIANATYVAISPTYKLDKWSFFATYLAAWADEVAKGGSPSASTRAFYNHNRREFFVTAPNSGDQSSFYGWEMDYGAQFKWDENFTLSYKTGFFFPGAYWQFANMPNQSLNTGGFMFASQLQAGITF